MTNAVQKKKKKIIIQESCNVWRSLAGHINT